MREMLENPVMTAYRSDTEPDRIERLHRAWGYAAALADGDGLDIANRVGRLHDHKGMLTVHWISTPTKQEKSLFSKAWASRIGDGADIVDHEVVEEE